MDELIEALTIFKKHLEGYSGEYPTHCEHDVLMIGCHTKDLPEKDAKRLGELGFQWNGEHDCWVSYKFGSS